MLVCLCNALSDRAIRNAAEMGATCCKQVWQSCGCRPDCGQCGPAIRELLAAHHGGRQVGTAPPVPRSSQTV